jgi:hypothetical protein
MQHALNCSKNTKLIAIYAPKWRIERWHEKLGGVIRSSLGSVGGVVADDKSICARYNIIRGAIESKMIQNVKSRPVRKSTNAISSLYNTRLIKSPELTIVRAVLCAFFVS